MGFFSSLLLVLSIVSVIWALLVFVGALLSKKGEMDELVGVVLVSWALGVLGAAWLVHVVTMLFK